MRLRRGRGEVRPRSEPGLPDFGPAPELHGVHPWLNTPTNEPLTLAGLVGGPVLVEFWAFACSNCLHTLPFLSRLSERYRGELTVVGVHTPELPLERVPGNVARAVRSARLTYPIGLDNDYEAWNAFGNRYWPTMYLLDAESRIRYTQIGEGQHRRTEAAIRQLVPGGSQSADS
jgi:thiol-disulfide isomerase/thioredoxin